MTNELCELCPMFEEKKFKCKIILVSDYFSFGSATCLMKALRKSPENKITI